MDINSLTDHQAELLMQMRVLFTTDDWAELDRITVLDASAFKKVYLLETLLLQSHNRYVRKHGTQPGVSFDDSLENSFVFN